MAYKIRMVHDKWNKLVECSQSLLSLKIIAIKVKLLPFFVPLLPSIIMFPDEMRPNLMIEHSLNCQVIIPDRQSNDDCAHSSHIVVYNTRC